MNPDSLGPCSVPQACSRVQVPAVHRTCASPHGPVRRDEDGDTPFTHEEPEPQRWGVAQQRSQGDQEKTVTHTALLRPRPLSQAHTCEGRKPSWSLA